MPERTTVLVADDEHLVRNGIRHLLAGYGEFQIVAEASNGQEVVELVQAHRPDIVIMDVRMPVMDGLAATERIRRINPATRTVILSGHSDFHYAQRALKLGASDYLTKPTDLVALIEVLARLRADIQAEAQARENEEKVRARLTRSVPAFLEQFYWHLLNNELLPEEVAERLDILEIRQSHASVLLIGIDHIYRLKTELNEEGYKALCFRLRSCLHGAGTPPADCPPILQLDDDTLILIYFTGSDLDALEYARRLKEKIKRDLRQTVSIAVGTREAVAELSLSYREARARLKQRLILGPDSIIARDVDAPEVHGQYPSELEKRLTKAIRFGDGESALAITDQICRVLEETGLSASGWRQLCFDLYDLAYRIARELDVQLGAVFLPLEKGKEIALLSTMVDVRQWLSDNLRILLQMIGANNAGPTLPVKKALLYLDEHFSEDLTLSMLAEYVKLSPNYLSHLLKQETGKSFGDHVTERRVEEAKHLLRRGELNVAEVAFRVGYEDPRYFSEVFRRLENVTPGQYRKGRESEKHDRQGSASLPATPEPES